MDPAPRSSASSDSSSYKELSSSSGFIRFKSEMENSTEMLQKLISYVILVSFLRYYSRFVTKLPNKLNLLVSWNILDLYIELLA